MRIVSNCGVPGPLTRPGRQAARTSRRRVLLFFFFCFLKSTPFYCREPRNKRLVVSQACSSRNVGGPRASGRRLYVRASRRMQSRRPAGLPPDSWRCRLCHGRPATRTTQRGHATGATAPNGNRDPFRAPAGPPPPRPSERPRARGRKTSGYLDDRRPDFACRDTRSGDSAPFPLARESATANPTTHTTPRCPNLTLRNRKWRTEHTTATRLQTELYAVLLRGGGGINFIVGGKRGSQ